MKRPTRPWYRPNPDKPRQPQSWINRPLCPTSKADPNPGPDGGPATYSPADLIESVRQNQAGFLTEHDVALLAGHPASRLLQLLVRCDGCRFLCAAQDVRHLVAIVESGSDDGPEFVRDVTLLARP